MRKLNTFLLILTCFTNTSCSHAVEHDTNDLPKINKELIDFASANCFFGILRRKTMTLKI